MSNVKPRTVMLLLGLCMSSVNAWAERDAALTDITNRPVGDGAGPNPEDTFTRMFTDLPAFAPQSDASRQAMQILGQKGGGLDPHDLLDDAKTSITEPARTSPNNPDSQNGNMTAGMTFLGQFLDHDVTLDLRSSLFKNSDPRQTNNFRTAAFDLDSVYGHGPDESPELYDSSSGNTKFLVAEIPGSKALSRSGDIRFDVPRGAGNVALIGDGRNDENLIISQLHCAVLLFHNAVIDRLKADPNNARKPNKQLFREAQRLVRWHYQWIITHEFLPATIGQNRVNALLQNGTRFYNAERERPATELRNGRRDPKIPVEFSAAAYRFGHSQIRPSYRINFGPRVGSEVFLFVFNAEISSNAADPDDLRGGKRAPRRFIDWQTFFDFGDNNVRPNKTIDTKLSSPMFDLPGMNGPATALPTDGVQSLASRNLARHVNFGLPSGQAIARRIGVPVLTPEQLGDLKPFGMDVSSPLWFYILREAEVMEQGKRLGPVGSLIVGEVFIGLLKADRTSYLSTQPAWQPELPSATPRDFRMTDLLRFAGVVKRLN